MVCNWGFHVSSLYLLKGYKDIVIQVAFLKILHDSILRDLRQKYHVVHATLLDIVALPVILVPAPLHKGENVNVSMLPARIS